MTLNFLRWLAVTGCLIVFSLTAGVYGQQPIFTQPASVAYARPGSLGNTLKPFVAPTVPGSSLANSARIHLLIKNSKMDLSVEDVIALAIENNLDIAVGRYDPAIAQTDYLRAQAGGAVRGVAGAFQSGALFSGAIGSGVGGGGSGGGGAGGYSGGGGAFSVGGGGSFDPAVGFSCGWNQSTVPLGITILQGVPVLTTHTSSCFSFLGQSFPTGTSFALDFFGGRQSTTGTTSAFNPQLPTQMAIGFTQPLLNGFGRRVGARFIRIAANEIRLGDSAFRQKLMTVVAQVLILYWDLASFQENVRVAQEALNLAEKSLSDNKQEVSLGVLAPIEVVRAQSEVARRQEELILARAKARDQEELLKTAISKQVDAELAAAEVIVSDQMPEPKSEDITTLDAGLQWAAKKRPEIEQAEINIRSQEIVIKASRNGLLPALGMFATYAPQGLSGDELVRDSQGRVVRVVPGGFFQSLSQTLHNRYPDYSVGLSLTIPLRNRTAQADLARTLLEERILQTKLQQQKNQVQQDVRRAVVAVNEARAEIASAREAVNMARQTLDGEQKKFQLGESDTFKVIQAQRDLVTAEGAEVTARANYAKALVQFAQATGTILEKNHIEIGEAKEGGSTHPS